MPLATHEYEVLIREHHLDTFGHVNNAAYLALFEEARWDLISGNGYGLDTIKEVQKGPVILEAALRFLREIKNRQRITIRSQLDTYRGKVARMRQTMIDEHGKVCCEATFTFALFDMTRRKLLHPTPEWLRGIGVQGPINGCDVEQPSASHASE